LKSTKEQGAPNRNLRTAHRTRINGRNSRTKHKELSYRLEMEIEMKGRRLRWMKTVGMELEMNMPLGDESSNMSV